MTASQENTSGMDIPLNPDREKEIRAIWVKLNNVEMDKEQFLVLCQKLEKEVRAEEREKAFNDALPDYRNMQSELHDAECTSKSILSAHGLSESIATTEALKRAQEYARLMIKMVQSRHNILMAENKRQEIGKILA